MSKEFTKSYAINRIAELTKFAQAQQDEVSQLKQQLAEKEKEIKTLKTVVDMIDKLKQYEPDVKQYILINPERVYTDGKKLIVKTNNQTAIEKLEEVAEKMEYEFAEFLSSEEYHTNQRINDRRLIYYDDIREFVDQQINSLKGEK